MAGWIAPDQSGRFELRRCASAAITRKVVPVFFALPIFWEGGDQYNKRSIANLDAAVYPGVTVPVAFANEPAHGLFDVYRRRRIVDRRRSRA
jgi:hypothetical protein